jgi:hypothetical protein
MVGTEVGCQMKPRRNSLPREGQDGIAALAAAPAFVSAVRAIPLRHWFPLCREHYRLPEHVRDRDICARSSVVGIAFLRLRSRCEA